MSKKRLGVKRAVQIFSVLLLVRDLMIFYRKNKKTIKMAAKAGEKFLKKRKAGR